MRGARAGDEDIDVARGRGRALERGADRGRVGDVGALEPDGLFCCRRCQYRSFYVPHRGLKLALCASHEGDAGAARGELEGHCAADARRAPVITACLPT